MIGIDNEKIEFFTKQGYLLIEQMFSLEEVEQIREQIENVTDLPGAVYEKNGIDLRSINGAHKHNPFFLNLCRQHKLLFLVKNILHSDVYIHQFKINMKKGFEGDVWQWHQDHFFWLTEDGMLEPDALTAAIFLTEANEFNAPMMLIPGSHNSGTLDAKISGDGWQSTVTADLKYTLDNNIIAEQVERNGLFLAKANPGDVLLFHSNILHASTKNISPYERVMLMISYNSINNKLKDVPNPRPYFLADRDYIVMEPFYDNICI